MYQTTSKVYSWVLSMIAVLAIGLVILIYVKNTGAEFMGEIKSNGNLLENTIETVSTRHYR